MLKFALAVIAALGGLAVSANGSAAVAQEKASSLQLVDFTDDFARIHDRDAALPDEERVERFKAEFATLLPGFYSHQRVGAPEEKYDEFLLNALKHFPEQRAGIARVSREFRQLLAPAEHSFEAAFGPMTGFPPILLVHSLGEFDGGTRDLPGGNRLLFGADRIDEIYKATPIEPFFHHELFHLLHARSFSGCEQVWCQLWTEGLAVHVASELNPGADDKALLLTWPQPLRPGVEANRQEALCYVAARLDSTDAKDHRALFSNGKVEGTSLPPRFGYYVGLLVARDAGRNGSLQQLAAMDVDEVRPLIEAAIGRLATCPAADSQDSGERG